MVDFGLGGVGLVARAFQARGSATLKGSPYSLVAPRNRATSSSGRWVADRPMRCGGRAHSATSRSIDSIRWAPRLVGTSA